MGLSNAERQKRFRERRKDAVATRAQLQNIIAEAYQVVGSLASTAGLFEHPHVQRALDVLSGKETGSMFPFHPEAE